LTFGQKECIYRAREAKMPDKREEIGPPLDITSESARRSIARIKELIAQAEGRVDHQTVENSSDPIVDVQGTDIYTPQDILNPEGLRLPDYARTRGIVNEQVTEVKVDTSGAEIINPKLKTLPQFAAELVRQRAKKKAKI